MVFATTWDKKQCLPTADAGLETTLKPTDLWPSFSRPSPHVLRTPNPTSSRWLPAPWPKLHPAWDPRLPPRCVCRPKCLGRFEACMFSRVTEIWLQFHHRGDILSLFHVVLQQPIRATYSACCTAHTHGSRVSYDAHTLTVSCSCVWTSTVAPFPRKRYTADPHLFRASFGVCGRQS